MPGTTMGATAKWKNPNDIKKFFFEKIRDKVAAAVGKPFDLVIEKDKHQSNAIHPSMFREAWVSEVYIADLTGRNPNVYLELGVRWAVRDWVTILVTQNIEEVGFNVSGNRVFSYSQDPAELQTAIETVSDAIVEGLKTKHCDNPVRLYGDLITVERKRLDDLEAEVTRLRHQRGEDLLAAAKAAQNPDERLRLFRSAVDVNPASVAANLELAQELRKAGWYDEAWALLQRAISLDPNNAACFRELGIVCGKMQQLDKAVEALRRAVQLAPSDHEALSSLGGALRRYGMREAPQRYDYAILRESRDSYANAERVQRHDTYALLNVARLDLILSKEDPDRKVAAATQLKKLQHLCSYQVEEKSDDFWRRFDLADSYLLSGDVAEGCRLYDEAMKEVPPEYRRSTFSSVAGPLEELRAAGVLDDPLKAAIDEILGKLNPASQSAA